MAAEILIKTVVVDAPKCILECSEFRYLNVVIDFHKVLQIRFVF